MRAPGAARPRGRERAARRRRAARHGWARLGWAEAAELSFPPPPPHPSLRPPPAHPRAAMDGGAFGAGKAGGAFDPHAFIRQPQTLLRLLSWVRGPSPTGGGSHRQRGCGGRGGTDGRTDSHRQRERAAGSLRGGCRDLGGTGGGQLRAKGLCVICALYGLVRLYYYRVFRTCLRMHRLYGCICPLVPLRASRAPHADIYVYASVSIPAYSSICPTSLYTHSSIYPHVCLDMWICLWVYVSPYVRISIYIYPHIRARTQLYSRTDVCTHVRGYRAVRGESTLVPPRGGKG